MTVIVVKGLDSDAQDFGFKQLNNKLQVLAEVADANGNVAEVIDNVEAGTLELAVNLRGHVCSANSSTTPLIADAIFEGSWQDTLDYGTITVGIKADQDSATDGLEILWSADGVTSHDSDVFTISANTGKVFTFGPARRYVKLKYTNSGSDQTSFSLQTILRRVPIKNSSHRISDSIVAEDDAELVKAVLTGENPAGTFVNFQSTTSGNFKISLEEFESDVSDDTNTKLKVSPYLVDEFGNVSRFLGDNMYRGCLLTMPVEHHEVHCGDSYESKYTGDLANGATVNFAIIVPNEGLSETNPGDSQGTKQYHVKIRVDTEAEALISFYEGATLSANGTALTIVNQNRNATLTDYLGFYLTPTITSDGTKLPLDQRIGSGKSIGGTAERGNELILKDNTIYLVRILNATTSNNYYNIKLDYYVHPGV